MLGEVDGDDVDTTRLALLPAWANALLMKGTRQFCQEAVRNSATDAFKPAYAPETTRFTPRRHREADLPRKTFQKVSSRTVQLARPFLEQGGSD
jgi:hypothetical protein